MRIDVDLPAHLLDLGLRRLQRRLRTPGDSLYGLPTRRSGMPDFMLRDREADGEYFVYVEHAPLDRLAGAVVFNRLLELNPHAERWVRSPHSRIAPAYRRRGLATAVYRDVLAQGICLVSGPRQSPGAHALWHALGRQHTLGYVVLRDGVMRWLGADVDAEVKEDFHTRMALLGQGWDIGRFRAEVESVVAAS